MFLTRFACMFPRHMSCLLRPCFLSLAVLSVAVETYAADKFGNALDWAPADVSFYSAALRMKEQVEIVASSNAWQKFREIPAVIEAWKAAETQMKDAEGPLAIALQMMELPENQQLLQVAADMFSSEVAVFGGQDAADFIELYQELNGANIVTRLQAAAGDPSAARELRMRAFFETLQESEDLLKTPDFVFAFRLTDQAAAESQLKRLEVLARMALRNSPFAERFKKEPIEGVEYLTLTLDGNQMPWDQFPWELVEQEEGEFDDLQETLAELKLVISLGIRDG